MQIVIEIPDKKYETLKMLDSASIGLHLGVVEKAILNGTPYEERKTGKWISVKEKLPKESGNYLCYIVNPYDSRLRYHMVCGFDRSPYPFSDEHYWFPDDETASDNVVAWMPLPEPYEEVDE